MLSTLGDRCASCVAMSVTLKRNFLLKMKSDLESQFLCPFLKISMQVMT